MTSSRKGLTLIELMATVAIVSLLTGAALTALTRASASANRQIALGEHKWLPDRLQQVFEADLMHAGECRTTEQGFALRTLAALRPDSMKLEHLPVEVEYRVQRLAGRSCLVRIQRSEDTGVAKNLGELVGVGVAGVTLETLSLQPPDEEAAWQKMTGTVLVAASFEDEDIPEAVYTYTFRKD